MRLSPSDRKTTKTVAITDLRSTETRAITAGVINTKERKLSGSIGGDLARGKKAGLRISQSAFSGMCQPKTGETVLPAKIFERQYQ